MLSSGSVMKILLIIVAEQYLHAQGLFWFLCCPAPEELGLFKEIGGDRTRPAPEVIKGISHTVRRCDHQ